MLKTRRAEIVALGSEVAAGKRTRQAEWYEMEMIFPDFIEMARDIHAGDRLAEMTNEAMADVLARRARR